MASDFLDLLAKHANGDAPRLAEVLDRAIAEMADVLAACDVTTREKLLARITERLEKKGGRDGNPWPKVTPEILAWARGLDTDEEILAGLAEIERTGGLRLEDFLPELKRAAGIDE